VSIIATYSHIGNGSTADGVDRSGGYNAPCFGSGASSCSSVCPCVGRPARRLRTRRHCRRDLRATSAFSTTPERVTAPRIDAGKWFDPLPVRPARAGRRRPIMPCWRAGCVTRSCAHRTQALSHGRPRLAPSARSSRHPF
jgi:hypothetical protein